MKKILILAILILLSSQSFALSSEECTEKGQQCAKDCEAICGQTRSDYCDKFDYSGCALDVFCWCNICGIYDTKWCPRYPDYLSCAEGAKGTYRGCIENCQSKREARQNVSTCWADCNEELNNKLIDCKQGPCQKFCEEKGFSNGEWARYTHEYGWDSCYCTGDEVDAPDPGLFPDEDIEPAIIPEELDSIPASEPELFIDEDIEEAAEPEPVLIEDIEKTLEPGSTPTKDFSPDYGDSSILETLIKLISGETIKDGIKYWFTPEENKGRIGRVGFVKAIKDKAGVRVYRKGKWMRVGIHDSLFPGDQFRTGPNSKVKLILLNTDLSEDVIYIRSNSLFEVEGTRYEDHDDTIRIVKVAGSVVATIKRRITGQKPNFYVKTPGIVLGIRGTKFYLSYDNSTDEMSLMVKEGEVEVVGKTTAIVKAGEQIEAENGILGKIEDLDASKWDEVTEQDWDEEGIEEDTNGFFSIPAVKLLLVLIILAGGFFGYKRYSKPKKNKR